MNGAGEGLFYRSAGGREGSRAEGKGGNQKEREKGE